MFLKWTLNWTEVLQDLQGTPGQKVMQHGGLNGPARPRKKCTVSCLGLGLDTWASTIQPALLSGLCQAFLLDTSTMVMGRRPGGARPIYRARCCRCACRQDPPHWSWTPSPCWCYGWGIALGRRHIAGAYVPDGVGACGKLDPGLKLRVEAPNRRVSSTTSSSLALASSMWKLKVISGPNVLSKTVHPSGCTA
jgi:hypothetical protein